jgi:hypothetical protein
MLQLGLVEKEMKFVRPSNRKVGYYNITFDGENYLESMLALLKKENKRKNKGNVKV